jgi:multicomponent K+:H+ antiporter subunit E
MKRVLPHPLLSLVLWGLWLLLTNSLEPGQMLLGLLLATVIPYWLRFALADHLPIHKPLSLLAYALLVLRDIVVANFVVAKQVLGPNRVLQPHFLEIPLTVTHPTAISLFASTITLTPGTVSCELSQDGRSLRVHALHTPDPAAEIAGMKNRYEQRLIKIFGEKSTFAGKDRS